MLEEGRGKINSYLNCFSGREAAGVLLHLLHWSLWGKNPVLEGIIHNFCSQ